MTTKSNLFYSTILLLLLISCTSSNQQKGIQVNSFNELSQNSKIEGLNKDSLKLQTKPSNVILTGVKHIRLTTIYKINYKNDNTPFIGTNTYHTKDETTISNKQGNNWNNHLIPGFEALYGYNLVNVSHYNSDENKFSKFFDKPSLINTLYYPSFSLDTLNYQLVNRNFFMVSVYNEDTNKDGYINFNDLRRFYLFNINGEKQKPLIPENYSVFKSEYDPENDFMYVFASLDENKNGSKDSNEPIHIFWINLKDTSKTGRHY